MRFDLSVKTGSLIICGTIFYVAMELDTNPSVLNLILLHGEYLLPLIIDWCSLRTQLDLARVSRDFKRLCDDNRMWKKLLRRDFNLNEDNNTKKYKKKKKLTPNSKTIYAQNWIRNRTENAMLKRCLIVWLRVELNALFIYNDFSDKIMSCQHLKTGFLPNDLTNDVKYFGCLGCNMWLHLLCDKRKAVDFLMQLSDEAGLPEKYKKEILGARPRISNLK